MERAVQSQSPPSSPQSSLYVQIQSHTSWHSTSTSGFDVAISSPQPASSTPSHWTSRNIRRQSAPSSRRQSVSGHAASNLTIALQGFQQSLKALQQRSNNSPLSPSSEGPKTPQTPQTPGSGRSITSTSAQSDTISEYEPDKHSDPMDIDRPRSRSVRLSFANSNLYYE